MSDTLIRVTITRIDESINMIDHSTVERVELKINDRQFPIGGVDPSGALLAVNTLSEFNTPQKRKDARTNIGLAVIDGGNF